MESKGIMVNVKDLLEKGKIIIGSERTLKLAKNGKIKEIYIASNTPKHLRNEAKIIGKALGIEVVELDENSKQIGTRLGKPFTILMFGVLK